MDSDFHPASLFDLRLNLMMKVRSLSREPAGKGATKRTLFNARSTDLSNAAVPETSTTVPAAKPDRRSSMALFTCEAARLLARANSRASASALAFSAADWLRTIGFKSSPVGFAWASFGVGTGLAGSLGSLATSFLGTERVSTFLMSAFGSGGGLTGSTGLAGVGARIWPFCWASEGGLLGLPPPPDNASSTSREGTTRTDGSERGRSDTKNAELRTSRSRRKRCIPAELNRHFFSSRLMLSGQRLGPQ